MIVYDDLPLLQETGQILDDEKFDWHRSKLMSLAVAKGIYKYETRFEKLSYRVEDCGSQLMFAESKGSEKRLISANFCKFSLCPICQRRKSMLIYAQILQCAQELLKRKKSTRFLFLTLTQPNVTADNLRDEVIYLNESWKRLIKRKQFSKAVRGWFRSMEITYNEQRKDYHPHFHCLIAVSSKYFKGKDYINHEEWLQLWRDATRYQNIQNVNVKAIRPNAKRGTDALTSAAAEAGKYTCKPSDFVKLYKVGDGERFVADGEVIRTIADAIYRRRMVAWGGDLKDIKKELKLVDEENADLIHVNDDTGQIEAIRRVLYKWNVGLSAYIC